MSDEVKKDEQTAVADTNEEPKKEASAESGAAQKDGLEELLKEFDDRKEDQTPREPIEAKSEPKGESKISLDALAALEERLNQSEARARRKELDNLCVNLSDGTNGDAVDAEAYLIAQAKRNPKLEQAYLKRDTNPKAWDEVYGALRKDFTKRWGNKVDKQATESREAMASAVRSASTAAPQKELSAKDVETMSRQDFDELQRKLGVNPV